MGRPASTLAVRSTTLGVARRAPQASPREHAERSGAQGHMSADGMIEARVGGIGRPAMTWRPGMLRLAGHRPHAPPTGPSSFFQLSSNASKTQYSSPTVAEYRLMSRRYCA